MCPDVAVCDVFDAVILLAARPGSHCICRTRSSLFPAEVRVSIWIYTVLRINLSTRWCRHILLMQYHSGGLSQNPNLQAFAIIDKENDTYSHQFRSRAVTAKKPPYTQLIFKISITDCGQLHENATKSCPWAELIVNAKLQTMNQAGYMALYCETVFYFSQREPEFFSYSQMV